MAKHRINFFDQMREFFTITFDSEFDYRPQHIALYCFLLQQNNRNGWSEWFMCPFYMGMQGSGIGNKKTYYKSLDDLQDNKLIKYEPGVNMWKAPRVTIIPLKAGVHNRTSTVPQCEPLPLQLPTSLSLSQLSALVSSLCTSLPLSQVGTDKDYKTIDYILKDLRHIIGVFENYNPQVNNDEKKDNTTLLDVVNDLMTYFKFTEVANPDKMLEAGRFVNLLNHQGKLEYFIEQFAAYKTYKQQSKQIPHGWRGFIGTAENQHLDGGWNSENWVAKVAELGVIGDSVTADDKADKLNNYLN